MASTRYWFSQHIHQQAYLTLYALTTGCCIRKQPQQPLVMSVVAKKKNDWTTYFCSARQVPLLHVRIVG
jgi:hypothetical protein